MHQLDELDISDTVGKDVILLGLKAMKKEPSVTVDTEGSK